MKKYEKPKVFIEQFELSKHIADCAWELTNLTKENCAAQPDEKMPVDGNLFVSSANGCGYIPGDLEGGNYEDYCYQNSSQSVNVFAS